MRKGIGTNKAEVFAQKLAEDCSAKGEKTKEHLKNAFVRNIMKIKFKDAKDEAKVDDFSLTRVESAIVDHKAKLFFILQEHLVID